MASLPPNAHISTHPCLKAKLSQLRSKDTNTRETKSLIHEIATIVGCEALASVLSTEDAGTDESPIGYSYNKTTISPSNISVVPILRSGLGMVDAIQSILPDPVPVHHLGLYREKTTLNPVEYYNNLPFHRTPSSTSSSPSSSPRPISDLAIIVDPMIATGATACAAIDSLSDWGVKRILLICVLASEEGLGRACLQGRLNGMGGGEGGNGGGGNGGGVDVQVWAGGCDGGTDAKGMIKPGLGDVGDRLFLTVGK
ncbi:PRTase-like protein [Aulographum hederae CBS 113979]|uniref:uracil phosphoribosyltransferase n=1 Tax=Aulographum hederae CBS 113979 TaxID=1176131 RepID=A0A6G1GJY5_9PEZI|nr:PRTase-like protein [Aulographum hederae CBS 113979]